MARASTPTLLPLDSYARIMGIDPRHFNGIVTNLWPATSSCNIIWYQYAWQNAQAVSREDLAEAIQQAEADMARELGFFLAPSWIEERQPWTFSEPRDHRFTTYIGLQQRGLRKSIRTEWAKVITGGSRATSPIAVPTAAPITWAWSDEDGDGEDDLLTIGNIDFGDVQEPCEVGVYFAGEEADEKYRIRPIEVDITAQTIKISRWLLIDPARWERQTGELAAADSGTGDPLFVTSVDIYRVYNSIEDQARFEWEPMPDEECDEVCGYWYQNGCLGLRDRKRGLAVPYPASYDSIEQAFTGVEFSQPREPDRVRLWYWSGEALDGCEMPRFWQRAIAYYATALLDREICGCEGLQRFMARWREPPSLEYELWPDRALSNPFGSQRGAIFAWDKVRQNSIGRGIAV